MAKIEWHLVRDSIINISVVFGDDFRMDQHWGQWKTWDVGVFFWKKSFARGCEGTHETPHGKATGLRKEGMAGASPLKRFANSTTNVSAKITVVVPKKTAKVQALVRSSIEYFLPSWTSIFGMLCCYGMMNISGKKKYVSQNPSKRYPVCILDSSVARSENMFSNLFFSAKDFGIHTESKRQQLVRIRSNKTLGSINQRPWGWHRISRGFKSSINSLSTYSPEHEGLEPQNHPKMKRKLICSIFVFQRCHNWRQCSKCQKPGRSGFM